MIEGPRRVNMTWPDAYRERLPDIVLLDIDMPRIGGIDAAWAMRKEVGEYRPFLIAMSGGADVDEVALTGLFDVVLRKPIDIDGLLKIFDRAIRDGDYRQ